MRWTDELEALTKQVKDRLGDLAAAEAFHRALAKAQHGGVPLVPGSLSRELAETTGGKPAAMQAGAFEEALKAELLALLRTH